MIGKCKDCIHWKKESDTDYGECDSKRFVYGEEVETMRPKEPDMLMYGDYEGYSAYFYTGPDFGCIHFERR